MNCATVRKYLDAYVDGEMEAGALLEVETHLESCTGCAAVAQVTRRIRLEVRQLPRHTVPEKTKAQWMRAARRRADARYWYGAGGLAAAAVLILALWPWGQRGMPVGELVNDVVARHVRELPMEIQTPDDRQAASWFRGKVDVPVAPLSAGIRNASFQGARVSHVREHQAAQLVYLVDGRKVTFMVFPADGVELQGDPAAFVRGRPVFVGMKNGYSVAMMPAEGVVYALSGHLPATRLIDLFRRTHL